MSWPEIKEELDKKIERILELQAKQLDAVVGLRDAIKRMEALEIEHNTQLERIEKALGTK